MDAPDAQTMLSNLERYGVSLKTLKTLFRQARAAGLTPAAIGSVVGLRANTVRRMMLDWEVE